MSDAAELEREAEASRARLSDTAEQLRARMSPGQMMDEVLNQFRDGDSGQMFTNLRSQIRDNPMALALVGSGLAWLMMGSGPESRSQYRPGTASGPVTSTGTFRHSPAGGAPRFAGDPGGGSSQAGERVGEKAGSGLAQGAADAMASARDAVGDRLHQAGEGAGQMARDLQAAATGAVGDWRHSAADLGQQTRRGFLDVLDREPLVIGALGLAVGAAIGALLPATGLERQHLGTAGAALKEKADALVDRGVAAAKEAASEVYATARDEADRQGLKPGDEPIASRVGAVVRAAGEKVGEIAEQHAPDPNAASEPRESATTRT